MMTPGNRSCTVTVSTIGFVCVRNAGRSQMAAAFAERGRTERGLEGSIEIVTGGTDPADAVHDVVVEVMQEVDVVVSDRVPRPVSSDELRSCDVVVTTGCSSLDLDADTLVRDWTLPDPLGTDPREAREIRETARGHVASLFDEIEASTA